MWTIEEGDREYFYGGGVGHQQAGNGYAPQPSYAYGQASHGYAAPYASTYSMDVTAMSPTVEIGVDMHSERSRRAVVKKLSKLKGVIAVDADMYSQKVTVTGNVTQREVLKKAGRKAYVWTGTTWHSAAGHHGYTPGYETVGTGALVYTS
eukprot:TRINITY_DN79_c0_g1_i2.p1 TRINITY_DN79_c0_g1~~TRINITY_DN79_c0_g1_i2.p1  ORF type:complete len:150 (-),score=6.85 TRINITY_DN79_c0_g1_i2:565-1014(-)